MKYLTGTSGGPELARLHQDVSLWDDQVQESGPSSRCWAPVHLTLDVPKPITMLLYIQGITYGVVCGNATAKFHRDRVSVWLFDPLSLRRIPSPFSWKAAVLQEGSQAQTLHDKPLFEVHERHQYNVPSLSVPRYSTRHVQAQYPVMGNQSEKHTTCCQYLPRKFLFLPAVWGSDSQPVSDGCQIIGNRDKAFTYPAGEAWKRMGITVGSSCSYVCDEQAHRKIFTQFLCLALFNLPPDVPAMP